MGDYYHEEYYPIESDTESYRINSEGEIPELEDENYDFGYRGNTKNRSNKKYKVISKFLNQKIDNYYVSLTFLTEYQIEKFTLYCTDRYQHKNYSFNINYKNKNKPNFFPFLFLLTKKEKKDNQTALQNNKKHTITFSGERFKKTCGKMIKINTQLNMILNINKIPERKTKKKLIKELEKTKIKHLKILKEKEDIIEEHGYDSALWDEEILRTMENKDEEILKNFEKQDSIIKMINSNNKFEDVPFISDFLPPISNLKETKKNKTIDQSFINKKDLKLYNVKNKIGNYYLFPVYIPNQFLDKLYNNGINILRNKNNKDSIDFLATIFQMDGSKMIYLYLTKTQINKFNNMKRKPYLYDTSKITKRNFLLLELSNTQIRKTFLKVIEFNSKLYEDLTSKKTKKQIRLKRSEPKTRNLIDFTEPQSKNLIEFTDPADDLIDFKTHVGDLIDFTSPADDLIRFD